MNIDTLLIQGDVARRIRNDVVICLRVTVCDKHLYCGAYHDLLSNRCITWAGTNAISRRRSLDIQRQLSVAARSALPFVGL